MPTTPVHVTIKTNPEGEPITPRSFYAQLDESTDPATIQTVAGRGEPVTLFLRQGITVQPINPEMSGPTQA